MSTPDTKTMNDQFHALCLDLIREWDSAPTSSDFIDTGGNGVIDRIREALLQSQAAVADSGKERQCEKLLTCHLTYFKKKGKFYTEGEFPVDSSMRLFEIWEMAEDMRRRADFHPCALGPCGSPRGLHLFLRFIAEGPGQMVRGAAMISCIATKENCQVNEGTDDHAG